jgi:hypothetical protein
MVFFNQPAKLRQVRLEQKADAPVYTHRIHRSAWRSCGIETTKKLRKDLWKRAFFV